MSRVLALSKWSWKKWNDDFQSMENIILSGHNLPAITSPIIFQVKKKSKFTKRLIKQQTNNKTKTKHSKK